MAINLERRQNMANIIFGVIATLVNMIKGVIGPHTNLPIPLHIIGRYRLRFRTFTLKDRERVRIVGRPGKERIVKYTIPIPDLIIEVGTPQRPVVAVRVSPGSGDVQIITAAIGLLPNWTTADKLFSVFRRQGISVVKHWYRQVKGVPMVGSKGKGKGIKLPDGVLFAMPRKEFVSLANALGFNPWLGQFQATIIDEHSQTIGKGLVIEWKESFIGSPEFEGTREIDLMNMWAIQKKAGIYGRLSPIFLAHIMLLTKINKVYGELYAWCKDSINEGVTDIFNLFAPADDDEEEDEVTKESKNIGVGIFSAVVTGKIPVPRSKFIDFAKKFKTTMAKRFSKGIRFRKLVARQVVAGDILPPGIVYAHAERPITKTFVFRPPMMGPGSIFPVVLIGKASHVREACAIVGYKGDIGAIEEYIASLDDFKFKLIEMNNQDLLALLGDSDGDVISLFGVWTGKYPKLNIKNFVANITEKSVTKGMGLADMDVFQKADRMALMATKGSVGLFDMYLNRIVFSALIRLEKKEIKLKEFITIYVKWAAAKHLFGVAAIKHRVTLGRLTSVEDALKAFSYGAHYAMEKAGITTVDGYNQTDETFIMDGFPGDTAEPPIIEFILVFRHLKESFDLPDSYVKGAIDNEFTLFYKGILNTLKMIKIPVVDDHSMRAALKSVFDDTKEEFTPDIIDEGKALRDVIDAMSETGEISAKSCDLITKKETSGWNRIVDPVTDPHVAFVASMRTGRKFMFSLLAVVCQRTGCWPTVAREIRKRLPVESIMFKRLDGKDLHDLPKEFFE